MKSLNILLFIACFQCLFGYHVSLLDQNRLAPRTKRQELMNILKSPPYIRDTASPLIRVTDFGADPTGVKDSTEAFNKAVAELLSRKKFNSTMADGINDLGGAVIDLEGGNYTISDTILFPYFYGNYQIKDGSIRASLTFPADKFMLQFGGDVACTNFQGSCIENIGLSHLFFDGSHVAAGNVKISKTMGSTLGPQLFFTGFNHYGIYLDGGHESMIHQAWFGAYYYSYASNVKIEPDCTAIYIHGNDHYVTDTIVFRTPLGMDVLNEATVINGFHIWNGQAEYGLRIRSRYVRMTNSYIDYTRMKIEGNIDHIILENTFFLEGTLVLEPHSQTATCQNFFMFNSDYQINGGKEKGTSIVYSQEFGKFTTIKNVKIENVFHTKRELIRMTKVQLTKKQTNATNWVFDLSNKLVFNRIGSVQYSIQNEENKAVGSYIKPFESGSMKVEIVTAEPVTGTVFLTVDENNDD